MASSHRDPCSRSSGEYLDLPRLWQALLTVGMFLWIAIVWRGMRARLKNESKRTCRGCSSSPASRYRRSTPWACFAGSDTHLSVADFWRFWVVHLWVEDFLELFTTVMVASSS